MNRRTIPVFVNGTFSLRTMSIMALVLSAGALLTPASAHGQIFVSNAGSNTIGEYNLDGTTVDASLVSELDAPWGIAVSGSDLFVTDYLDGTISEYTTSGASVNDWGGLNYPDGVAVSGSDVFVANWGTGTNGGTIGEYTTSGATVNAELVSGLGAPEGIVESTVPEPATALLLLIAGAGILMRRRRCDYH